MLSHIDFGKATKCSFYKIMIARRDSDVRSTVGDIKHLHEICYFNYSGGSFSTLYI